MVLIVFSILFGLNNIYATNETSLGNGTNLTIDNATTVSPELSNVTTSNSTNSTLNDENSENSTISPTISQASVYASGDYSYITIDQIKTAASTVRGYIETYHKLPDYVLIGTDQVKMPQFLELLTTALLQITSGNNSTIPLKSFSAPTNPKENIITGNLYKSEYMKLASDIKNYMDSSSKAPDYAYGTSLGTYLRYENLVYMYTMILDYYNTSGKIAGWATMEPWSTIASKPFVDPNAPKFTITQMKQKATELRNYIETYHMLPDYIQIDSTQVTMPQFLELLTTALLQINNGNNNSIVLRNFSNAINPKESIHTGNMYKSEYMKLANDIKNYMDSTGKTPDYAYGTSLGTYLRYENLVYMYTMILDYYNTSGKIADWAAMVPWSSKPVIDPNAPKFTITQITDAASRVKSYAEKYYKLPSNVQIGSSQVSMPQFLELLTTALLQINNGNSSSILLRNFIEPTNQKESISEGKIYKSEYLKLASDIKNYMDSSGKAPDYAYGTSLGAYLRFENMVYMYSMILSYYNTSGNIADYASMEPWPFLSGKPGTLAPDGTKLALAEIEDAASRVRGYIESYHRLPGFVIVGSSRVNMTQFLELSTTALLQITNGNSSSIALKSFSYPENPMDMIHSGNIYKSEYLKLASDIKNYMDSTGKAPDYAYGTSIGTYLGYHNLVYMYSMILDYYSTSGKIADWAAMKPWLVTYIPSELLPYIAPTANCEVNDTQIQTLSARITGSCNSTYEKAVAIFNWVRDNIGYSFYYNTLYGAIGTLNAETGNCVDTTHLLIALERASGIPAKYIHGSCTFNSGTVYGHVWAQVWVDGAWYVADATSYSNTFGVIKNWNTDTYTFKGEYISLPF